MKRILNFAFTVLTVLAAAACTKEKDPEPPVINFEKSTFNVVPGGVLEIPFTIDNATTNTKVEAKSSDAAYVFTASLKGESAGVIAFTAPEVVPEAKELTVTLTATDGDLSATGNVKVNLIASDAILVTFENETYRFTPGVEPYVETINYTVEGLGSATIAEVNVSATNDWTVVKGTADNTVDLTIPAEGESTEITIKVTDNFGRSAEASTTVALNEIVNLTTEHANSFLVAPGSLLRFSVSHKGNSYAEEDVLDPVTVSLLWQDVKGMVSSVEFDASSKTVLVQLASGISGNAVVAAYGADEKIAWSWHLWVTEYDPLAHAYQVYSPKEDLATLSDYYWVYMDRDLGATTGDPKSTDFCGNYYQWGRKDPFPRLVSHDRDDDQSGNRPVYDIEGNEVEIEFKQVEEENNLQNAIENPTTFYTQVSSTYCDWYSSKKLNPVPNHDFWGGESHTKGLYDPCPAGWRVPEGNYVDYPTYNSASSNGFWPGFYVSFHDDDDPAVFTDTEDCRKYFYGKLNLDDTTGDGWYFPFSGWMSETDGEVSGCDVGDGNQLYNRAWIASRHWTVTSIKGCETTVSAFLAGGGLGVRTTYSRARGNSVRCVKDIDFRGLLTD